jgi:hypothetical protein
VNALIEEGGTVLPATRENWTVRRLSEAFRTVLGVATTIVTRAVTGRFSTPAQPAGVLQGIALLRGFGAARDLRPVLLTDRRVIVKARKTGPLSADWHRIRRVRRKFGSPLRDTAEGETLTLPNLREARAAEALIRERRAP